MFVRPKWRKFGASEYFSICPKIGVCEVGLDGDCELRGGMNSKVFSTNPYRVVPIVKVLVKIQNSLLSKRKNHYTKMSVSYLKEHRQKKNKNGTN